MEIGYLRRDIREWISAVKRCRWVTAWRIVDAKGDDMIFPWPGSKREARETAEAHGIALKGEWSDRDHSHRHSGGAVPLADIKD